MKYFLSFLSCAFLTLVSFAGAANAEDLYVSQAGGGTGAACNNALNVAFFNTSSNWAAGAGKISPGDTVHLCGTFTGSVGQQLLTVQGSGTAGNYITIKFEPGAKLTSPSWSANGAIHNGPDPISYIIVDGGTTCGRVSGVRVECNGIIENTDTGTFPTFANNAESTGIYFRYCNHCIVKNLAVSNIWVKTSNDEQGGGDSIHVDGDDVQLTNNIVHDSFECVASGSKGGQTSTNKEFAYNIVYNCNFGMQWGNYGDNAIQNGFKIHDNESYDWSNWDNPVVNGVGNHFHHNGVIVQWQGGQFGTINNLEIYNNYFHGNTGALMTGEVFIDCEQTSGGCAPGMLVYNNVFVAGADGQVPDNGMFVAGASGFTISLLNNTFAFTSKIAGGKCANWTNPLVTSKNNIFLNCDLVHYDVNATMAASDYNDFYNFTDMGPGIENPSLASWRTATGFDAHSLNVTPGISTSTFLPTSGGAAVVGTGNNLTNLGVANLNLDASGVTRPGGSTAWDIGALQFAGASPGPFTVTVQSVNPATGVTVTATTDNNGLGNGTTSFARVYDSAASPVFVAAATAGSNAFSSWTGCTTPSGRTCTMTTLAGSATIVANYAVTPPVTITVSSTNPASGVSISATPDNNANGTGTSSFARVYSIGASPVFVAPLTVSGNTFLSWSNCTSPASNTCTETSVQANTTITANYAAVQQNLSCQTGNASVTNVTLASQTATFTIVYDDTPSQLNMDGVLGFSNGVAAAYSDMAVITRFNSSGFIDGYNQGVAGYAAVNAIPYLAGVPYHFRLVIDTVNGVYDGYVTAPGGVELKFASAYTFRTGAESLNNWAVVSEVGAHTACSLTFPQAGTPPGVLIVQNQTLPTGTVGQPYTASFLATSGSPPYLWSTASLIPGLTVSATGVLSGKPTAQGQYSITAVAKDAKGQVATLAFPLTVNAAPPVYTLVCTWAKVTQQNNCVLKGVPQHSSVQIQVLPNGPVATATRP